MTKNWIMADGRTIAIRHMADSHLLNTIKFLQRRAALAKHSAELECTRAESMLHGEMASFYAARDTDRILDMSPQEFLEEEDDRYQALVAEAERRKLEIPDVFP